MEGLTDYMREAHPQEHDVAFLRVINSASIPICTYSRGSRCQSIPLDQRDEWVWRMHQQENRVLRATLPRDSLPGSDD